MITVIIFEPDPMVSRILTEAVQAEEGLEALKTVRDIKLLPHVYEALHPQLVLGETAETGLLDWFRSMRAEGCPVDLIPVTRARDAAHYQQAFALGIVDYLIKPFQAERLSKALHRYVRWKNGLLPDQQLTQTQLDRLTTGLGSFMEEPFYGNDKTRQKVLIFIAGRGGESFTAAEAAKAVGLSPTTVRRYLEQMQKEGLLEVLPEYGHVGRPIHHYRTKERET